MARGLLAWLGTRRRTAEGRRVAELASTATPPPISAEAAERARREKKARLLAGLLEAAKRGGRGL
jgi:hypothetical protein